MKMTTEEAFVKVLQMHGIEHAFGIIGSAMMPISDLFGKAGITFWDVAHETNGGLIWPTASPARPARSRWRSRQNGPGVTGFVTAVKTAYWNHTPMLLVTPAGRQQDHRPGRLPGSRADGAVRDMVCYQEEVRDPIAHPRGAEPRDLKAKRLSAPAQINMPRDYWTQVIDIALPAVVEFERPSGGKEAIAEAAKLLSRGLVPGHPVGRGRRHRRRDPRDR
jgi:sulfoacetaldehyde acetyltransferase